MLATPRRTPRRCCRSSRTATLATAGLVPRSRRPGCSPKAPSGRSSFDLIIMTGHHGHSRRQTTLNQPQLLEPLQVRRQVSLAHKARRADLVQGVGAPTDRLDNGAMHPRVTDLVGQDERRLGEEHASRRQNDIAQAAYQSPLGLEPLQVGRHTADDCVRSDKLLGRPVGQEGGQAAERERPEQPLGGHAPEQRRRASQQRLLWCEPTSRRGRSAPGSAESAGPRRAGAPRGRPGRPRPRTGARQG